MQMNEREKLLKRLSAHQFSMWELHMYLDTHMNDPKAMASYKKHEREYKVLKAEYERQYGPLTPSASVRGADWICDPWPWDIGEATC